MEKKELGRLLTSILVCLLAAFIGSLFTTPQIGNWYSTLIKPSWNPPSTWFAPVWTLLFILMGVAIFYVWGELSSQGQKAKRAMLVFYIQLVANILWSVFFFGLNSPLLGFLWIIILWVLIILTIVKFWRVHKLAAMLLLPYILWVSFAAYLNYTIWQLNR